jgi:hypothetical protein
MGSTVLSGVGRKTPPPDAPWWSPERRALGRIIYVLAD